MMNVLGVSLHWSCPTQQQKKEILHESINRVHEKNVCVYTSK